MGFFQDWTGQFGAGGCFGELVAKFLIFGDGNAQMIVFRSPFGRTGTKMTLSCLSELLTCVHIC